MDWNTIETILNLFDDFLLCGKALKINIDEHLLKIIPLPRKLIIDLFVDPPMSTFFHLSDDQKSIDLQNNVIKKF